MVYTSCAVSGCGLNDVTNISNYDELASRVLQNNTGR